MEVNTIVNHSALYKIPDGSLHHILKEPESPDQDLRHPHDSVQEKSQKSEMDSSMAVDSGLLCNGTTTEDPSMSVVNGEYCGLGTRLSIDCVDIFEILRAEVLAAEAREIEAIENGFLSSDERGHEFQSAENDKEIVIVEHGGPGSIESSVLQDKTTMASDLALAQDGVEESKTDDPKRGFPVMQTQPIEEKGHTQLDSSRPHCRDAEGTNPDTEGIDPSGYGQAQLWRCSAPLSDVEGTGPDKRDVDPSDNGQPQFESSSPYCRHAEETGPDKGDRDPFDNVQGQLGNSIAYPKDAEGSGLKEQNVGLCVNGKGENGDQRLQNVEGMGAENVEAALGEDDKGVQQREEVTSEAAGFAGSTADLHQNIELAGNDGISNILIVEVTGDAEGIGINKGNTNLRDNAKGDNGEGLSQRDKHSEDSEDEDYTSSAFSGPIAFSGMLSYSGMISYSGQIPYSGNLSLHSDSSASTRSFAFPILASDWNSSPTKIGPPDNRFFRRRRRWRPRFCCRRPTTLFD